MTHKSLAEALAAAQAEYPLIVKLSQNPHFRSTYASLSDGMEPVRPILAKHGIAYTQVFTSVDGTLVLRTKLKFGEQEEVSDIPCEMMPNVQQFMSKQTYLRRCALFAILGLTPADEDDDGNVAAHGPDLSQRRPNGNAPKTPAPEPASVAERKVEDELLAGARKELATVPEKNAEELGSLRSWLQCSPEGQNTPRWKLIASLDKGLMDQLGGATKKRVAELEVQAASHPASGTPPSRQDGQPPRRQGTPEDETNAALAASERQHALVRDAEAVLNDVESATDRNAVIGAWKWLNTRDDATGATPFDRLGKIDRDLRNRFQYLCHEKAKAMGINLKAVAAA